MYFAFIFDSVGGTEWFVLLGVILIVVGPKNLPSAARTLGNVMAKLRRAADEFKRQLLSMDEEFKKGVENAVNDSVETPAGDASSSAPSGDSTVAETPSTQMEDGADRAATDYYGGEYDPSSPYPGHDYYDETQYQNEPYTGDASAEASPDGSAAAPAPEPEKPKADPYAVKITVSTTAGDAGKHA